MFEKLKEKVADTTLNLKSNLTQSISNLTDEKIIKVKTSSILKEEELVKKFKMDAETKNRIKDDMRLNGFSKAHPIHVWLHEGKLILVDGHTRFQAASELGFQYVWIQIHNFTSMQEALMFSMQEQFNRRNITDSELFQQYETLRQEKINGRNLTMQEKADQLKKSRRHLFKIETVQNEASDEVIRAIKNGKMSINKAYNDLQEQKKKKRISNEVVEDSSQKIEKEINSYDKKTKDILIKYEHKIKNEIQKKKRELEKKETELNQKNKLSDLELFKLGIKFAFVENTKGKTLHEIFSDYRLSKDFDVSSIQFSENELKILEGN